MPMKAKVLVLASAIFIFALTGFKSMSAAEGVADLTLSKPVARYIPTFRDLTYNAVTAGDAAEADVEAVGTELQYTGLVLNGNGVDPNALHPFLKVQGQ